MLRTTTSVTTKVYWKRRLGVESRNLREKIKIYFHYQYIHSINGKNKTSCGMVNTISEIALKFLWLKLVNVSIEHE